MAKPMLYAGRLSEMPYEEFCVYEYCLDADSAAPQGDEALMQNMQNHQERINRALKQDGWQT